MPTPLNDRVKGWTGVGVAALFLLVAGNGTAFLEVLRAVPPLISAWASGLPAGLWNVAIAWLVGMVAYGVGQWWLPSTRAGRRAAETGAILITAGVLQLSLWGEHSAPDRLKALWLGLIAGYAAPYVARRIGVMWGLTRPANNAEDDAEQPPPPRNVDPG